MKTLMLGSRVNIRRVDSAVFERSAARPRTAFGGINKRLTNRPETYPLFRPFSTKTYPSPPLRVAGSEPTIWSARRVRRFRVPNGAGGQAPPGTARTPGG